MHVLTLLLYYSRLRWDYSAQWWLCARSAPLTALQHEQKQTALPLLFIDKKQIQMLKYLFWTFVFLYIFLIRQYLCCCTNPTSPLISNTLHFTCVYTCGPLSFLFKLTTHLTNNLFIFIFLHIYSSFVVLLNFSMSIADHLYLSSLLYSWAYWAQA